MSASRQKEDLSQPPRETKPEDQLFSSSQPNWRLPGTPCSHGATAVLMKGSCQTSTTCENHWPYGAGGHGGELIGTVMAFGSKNLGSDSNIDTLGLHSVWVGANFVCVQTTKGCISWPSSILALCYHLGGKEKLKKGPIVCTHSAKEQTAAVSSCKQVVIQNCQIHGKGWRALFHNFQLFYRSPFTHVDDTTAELGLSWNYGLL